MNFENIVVREEDGIRTIRIQKKSDLNPLDLQTLKEIMSSMSEKPMITIITGSERAFSAGADIKNFSGLKETVAYSFSREGHTVMNFISSYQAPVIASIRGYALGGGFELALACDFRIATPSAKLGLTELNIGIIPGWGGTQRLRELVGEQKALYLIATSKVLSGEEALRYGILLQVSENPDQDSRELALALRQKSSFTLKAVKSLVRSKPTEGYDEEKQLFGMAFSNPDSREGVQAFLEKRKPVFNR
jgi:enoyl-CoA hydratase/carnithine racemase